MRGMRRFTDAEIALPPELAKIFGNVDDGCGSLGQAVGAQGVLFQPEWIRGYKHTLDLSPGCAGAINS